LFYDALTLRAYVAEASARFPLPWFVQKLSQVGDFDYLLSCRLGPGRRLRWLISLQVNAPTLRWWRDAKPQARPPSAFTMLCRKHLQGRSFDRIETLYPERIVRLATREHVLVIELLDRQPNLLLLDALGNVLGGHKLGRGDERELRPRRPYRPPSRPDVPDADKLTAYQLEEIYLSNPPAWPQHLLQHTFGLSPAACSRLSKNLDELSRSWADMWRQASPGSYRAEQLGNGRLTIWGDSAEGPRALLAAEEESSPRELPGAEQQRQRGLQQLAKAQQRLRQRLEKLEGDRRRVGEADRLQREGELLLTYGHGVPRGATTAELTDWDGETRIVVTLDPARGVVDEAQRRLRRAAKYRRSLPVVEDRVGQTEAELRRLEEASFQMQSAETPEEIQELLAGLAADKRPVARPGSAPKSAGPRRYRYGDYLIYVGRSPKQNDMLVQRLSARDDLWFHVKDSPGAHVVLKTAGRSPEEEHVEAAATLAARYSSRARDPKVLVSFTSAQRVKKPSGSPAGFVLYTEELTLWVRPDALPEGLQREPG
jgi:predicted ribosome quality control (RQC) complex YloA/Tae2 family protein